MKRLLCVVLLAAVSPAAADTLGANPNDQGRVTAIQKGVEELDLGGIFVLSHSQAGDAEGSTRISSLGERALAIRDRLPDDDEFQAAGTRWTAAQTIYKLGTDRARARVLAKEARALYAKAPDPQAQGMVVEIDQWLAGHRAR